MAETKRKRTRRGDEQLITDLQAKIAAIKARAARKRAKGNPAVRHTVAAVRSIDKATAAADDQSLRKVLEEARGGIAAWLALEGIAVATKGACGARTSTVEAAHGKDVTGAPTRRRRPRESVAT